MCLIDGIIVIAIVVFVYVVAADAAYAIFVIIIPAILVVSGGVPAVTAIHHYSEN